MDSLDLMQLKITNENGDQQSLSKESRTSNKREGYIEWDEYFMAVAFLSAQRSKDPVSQVGACIVNKDKKIVGIGYNGMPNGCPDDQMPWGKHNDDELENKYMYVCHAEMNAIMNKNSHDVKGCTIYTSMFPCNECAKLIIQAGISNVVYMSDKHRAKKSVQASKRMFDIVSITYSQFVPKQRRITIDFESLDSSENFSLNDSFYIHHQQNNIN